MQERNYSNVHEYCERFIQSAYKKGLEMIHTGEKTTQLS